MASSIRQTFSDYAVKTMDNTAELLSTVTNTVTNGAKELVRQSDKIWGATAVAYSATYAIPYVNTWISSLGWGSLPKIIPADAARAVVVASSIYVVLQGFFADKNTKSVDLKELPNKELVMLMNAAAATLCLGHRFGNKLGAIESIATAALSFGSVKMLHNWWFPKA